MYVTDTCANTIHSLYTTHLCDMDYRGLSVCLSVCRADTK